MHIVGYKGYSKMKKIEFLLIASLAVFFLGGTTKAQTSFEISKNDSTLVVSMNKKTVLHYWYSELPPPAGEDEKWARSGFIHPLFSPSGEVLTWAQPPDHLHHMGLWNPWTRVTWIAADGSKVLTDFWNLGDEQGTVRFADFGNIYCSNSEAEFSIYQDHVAFLPDKKTPEGKKEVVVIKEEWIVSIEQHPQGYILDFTSLIVNQTSSDLSLDAYRYGGGIGYRATGAWNNKNSSVLTSEGKTWKDGDATRAKWCRVSGDLKGINTGLLFLSHPSNYDFPQPMRIWPDNSNGVGHQYFEFTPIREKAWILEPGKGYSQKYRILVYEGDLDAKSAEDVWQQYSLTSKDLN